MRRATIASELLWLRVVPTAHHGQREQLRLYRLLKNSIYLSTPIAEIITTNASVRKLVVPVTLSLKPKKFCTSKHA